MILPLPCHFGKRAIMIYDDSFSGSPFARRNNTALAQKEGSGACNRDMDLKMPNFSLRETATFPSLQMAI